MREVIGASDLVACRALLRGGSKSFHAASLLLPRRVMVPATGLYAFCRVADDLIDGEAVPPADGMRGEGPGRATRRVLDVAFASPTPGPFVSGRGEGVDALSQLKTRLDLVYAGRPADHAADRALAAVVAAHRVPRTLLDGLLEGFAWDRAGRRYATLADLEAYAARVAGTVGAMMAVLMGVRDPDLVARACDLGVAMQFSNIARDVGEDARAGRLYLPLDWLAEAGIDADRLLAAPAFTPALGAVVGRLVEAAEALYRQADVGIAGLPWDCRPGIGAARRLYAGIGHRVMQAGGNSVDGRAVVGRRAKLGAVGRAAVASVRRGGAADAAPLPAVRHLVAAVAASTAPRPAAGRLVWLLELFAELDSRQGRFDDRFGASFDRRFAAASGARSTQ